MIGFSGIRTYENKDWLMQLPFILVNAGQQKAVAISTNSPGPSCCAFDA
jgi:chloride channel 7